jgi:hypothetical protein
VGGGGGGCVLAERLLFLLRYPALVFLRGILDRKGRLVHVRARACQCLAPCVPRLFPPRPHLLLCSPLPVSTLWPMQLEASGSGYV